MVKGGTGSVKAEGTGGAGGATRREFIKTTAVVAGALAAPLFIPARLLRGQTAPSNRIRVGQIGAGRIATQHDMPGVLKSGLADYVAICDLDSRRAPQGKAFIEKTRTNAGAAPEIKVYTKYEELLADKSIQAVVISLPDHQHAQVALAAVKAGKDIYLQKPFTMTHEEGMMLRDAIVKAGIIFQVGSQQRSWVGNAQWNDQFRKACMCVRNGRVGNLKGVEIGLPTDPTQADPAEMPVPANLDYDRWLGSTPQVFYTEDRVHSQKADRAGAPDVASRPGWLR
ncbi:MAG TPA: Gfo/Idh/MocA family oxidoreductase, partial [Phycisphaerae bacterium]